MNPADDDRALVSSLARRDDVLLLPVLVPAGAEAPRIHPLTVLLLAQLRQVTLERDAYRAWITQDPAPPGDEQLRTRTADTAGLSARTDSP
ncbi:hypothetical protein [Streptomyces graminilatus]|uniref:hypothetical protein n=1 Tax=Streptomyces graminilatus TaxID=1464070 RepID=UPI0006E25CAF|nr:hypothetical protein [Streptomyces graminilatus]